METLKGKVEKETEKAICLQVKVLGKAYGSPSSIGIWIPKSQVREIEAGTYEIPAWLYDRICNEKNLFGIYPPEMS